MNALYRLRFLLMFFVSNLFAGCSMPADEVDDESAEFDGQIGQTQQAVTQADKDWWKNLWQVSRNYYIMMRANQDRDKYVALNCKEWARKVVFDASKGVVSLPSTYPNANGWQWYGSSYVQQLSGISATLPGDVVQMNLQTGPHTAIVFSNDGTNVCWMESNWNLDNWVHSRCETVTHFLNAVTIGGVQKYTAYRITGG